MIQNGKYVEVTENDFGPDQRCDFLMDFMQRKAKAKQPFKQPTDVAFDGKSQLPFLKGQTDTHREWIYADARKIGNSTRTQSDAVLSGGVGPACRSRMLRAVFD